jgi:threonine dehydratase
MSTTLVSIREIQRAAAVMQSVAVRTPLLRSDDLSGATGVPLFVKPEMLQHTGTFKFRGAWWFVSQLDRENRRRGLVAPSSGNHGQAVALAAREFGARATVVMPTTAPRAKVEGAERLGATVTFAGTTSDERMQRAREICESEGMTLVPPYDDLRIIAGQGSLGIEIVEQLCETLIAMKEFAVLVPVGGGGISAGVAAAVKQVAPGARVIGVEPAGSPKLSAARAAGEPVTVPWDSAGITDGLLAVRIGAANFPHHAAFVDDVVQVEDSAIGPAMRFLRDRHKLIAEPSGAICVAAVMSGAFVPSMPTVCILSGGNVDHDTFETLTAHPVGGTVVTHGE